MPPVSIHCLRFTPLTNTHRTERGKDVPFVRVDLQSALLIFAAVCSSTLWDCRPLESEILHLLLSLPFLAISQKSHWAENKHSRTMRHEKKKRCTDLWKRSLDVVSFKHTSGSGRLFVSDLRGRSIFHIWKADIQCVGKLSSSAVLMAQLLCGRVYISGLVKWGSKSSSRGVVIYVYSSRIGISIGAAAREVKDTIKPQEALPYICLFPQHTHTYTQTQGSQTIILIIPD